MELERFVSRQVLLVCSPEVRLASWLLAWKQGTIESNIILASFKRQFMSLQMSHHANQTPFCVLVSCLSTATFFRVGSFFSTATICRVFFVLVLVLHDIVQ